MKIRGDYMLDTIGGEKIAVPLGAGENNQTGLVRLNEVGAFLWEKLMEGTTEEDLVQDVTKQYEVGTEKAAGDVKKFLEKLNAQKKAIYERYREGFKDLPIQMNPYDEKNSEPNFWLSCMIIDPEAMCKQVRGECEALYVSEPGKSCPTEILEAIAAINAEGRPIWKPMHMQPIYRMNAFVTREGNGRAKTNAYISGGTLGKDGQPLDVGMDIFHRGLCLPSDNKMTPEQQDVIIETVKNCFK